MIRLAIFLALLSLVAGAFGFTGLAGAAAGLAKLIFGVILFLLLCAVVLIALGISIF